MPAARVRAWLEVLRAPLLLSPVADVLAGAGAMAAGAGRGAEARGAAFREALPALGLAAATGVCLLAAGMAQNAVADAEDDRLRKPGRPLPRGALGRGAVLGASLGLSAAALLLAACVGAAVVVVAGAIVLLTAAYHLALKRRRDAGSLALGVLRGLDLLLGAAAVEASFAAAVPSGAPAAPGHGLALLVAATYALFIGGAALHATTDDEPFDGRRPGASRVGVGAHAVALAFLLLLLLSDLLPRGAFGPVAAAGLLLVVLAALRVRVAARTLAPGPLTGVLLSGLFLVHAGTCGVLLPAPQAGPVAAAVLLLFWGSRRLGRVFPPT